MAILILGLVIFLGLHSVRIFADDWRTAMRTRLGDHAWKGLYSVVSLAGFGLIVWGYGIARQQPVVVWSPPRAMAHVAAPLMVIAFILLAAAYVPRNSIKAKIHHPMTLAVKTWALAHLLANGTLHDIVLFGGFLLWSVLLFRAARRRDRAAGATYPAGTAIGTTITVVLGFAASVLFAHWLHLLLIGVSPFQ